MAMHCVACGGIIPDLTFQGIFTKGCDTHIKHEINIQFGKTVVKLKAQSLDGGQE